MITYFFILGDKNIINISLCEKDVRSCVLYNFRLYTSNLSQRECAQLNNHKNDILTLYKKKLLFF